MLSVKVRNWAGTVKQRGPPRPLSDTGCRRGDPDRGRSSIGMAQTMNANGRVTLPVVPNHLARGRGNSSVEQSIGVAVRRRLYAAKEYKGVCSPCARGDHRAGIQAEDYGTRALRYTKASIILRATGTLRAVQIPRQLALA